MIRKIRSILLVMDCHTEDIDKSNWTGTDFICQSSLILVERTAIYLHHLLCKPDDIFHLR
jgi:hypothetical protein